LLSGVIFPSLSARVADPALKTEWRNIPLSLPSLQASFYEDMATLLGISRNACLVLALRIGGPILHEHAESIKKSVQEACLRISKRGLEIPPVEISEILVPTEIAQLAAIKPADERRNRPASRKQRR
jgi:hypothetical protein